MEYRDDGGVYKVQEVRVIKGDALNVEVFAPSRLWPEPWWHTVSRALVFGGELPPVELPGEGDKISVRVGSGYGGLEVIYRVVDGILKILYEKGETGLWGVTSARAAQGLKPEKNTIREAILTDMGNSPCNSRGECHCHACDSGLRILMD